MADVLFICTGNFYRSRFAEAVFNHHAEQLGIAERACSRGISPHEGSMSPYTERAMAERSIDMARTTPLPTKLTVSDLARAKQVIAVHEQEHRPLLAKHYPEWVDRVTYWSVGDLPLAPEVALPMIERHVMVLMREFQP